MNKVEGTKIKMETIKEIQAGIIEDFEIFDDWIQKYEYLIDDILMIYMFYGTIQDKT